MTLERFRFTFAKTKLIFLQQFFTKCGSAQKLVDSSPPPLKRFSSSCSSGVGGKRKRKTERRERGRRGAFYTSFGGEQKRPFFSR